VLDEVTIKVDGTKMQGQARKAAFIDGLFAYCDTIVDVET